MITEIPRNSWKEYFDGISRALDGWETSVAVLSDDIGAQALSSGLPFSGLTLDEKDGRIRVELNLGTSPENHQTHTIEDPVRVSLEGDVMDRGSMLDIEDLSGSKTLIKFVQPYPVLISCGRTELVGVF
jgi:hypothetical protein